MTQDLRLAFRLMVRQPLMATTAIVALTVGIGLANVGFATMEAMLFSKLPFDEDGRFVRLSVVDQLKREPVALTAEGYGRLSAMPDTLDHVGAVTGGRETIELPSGGREEVAIAGLTSSSLPYLKAVPLQGRLLTT